MKSSFDNFIGLYPVSKTIRMELRPVGKTPQLRNQGCDDVRKPVKGSEA